MSVRERGVGGGEVRAPLSEQVHHVGAVEVVRLGQCDPELHRAVDAWQLPTHPVADGRGSGIRHRVRRAFGSVALAVDAHLGDESGPLETRDGVVDRTVRDRDQTVVAADPQEPDHLVRMHVALGEQRQQHQAEGGEPVRRVLHP